MQSTQIPSSYYRISLKAIVRNDDGEVLVNKESGRDTWSLPGGGWEHGETDIECLKRELLEEVGYIGEFTAKPVATTREPIFMRTAQAWLVWIVYEVIPGNMDFATGEESDEVKFVDPESFRDSANPTERLIYEFCAN